MFLVYLDFPDRYYWFRAKSCPHRLLQSFYSKYAVLSFGPFVPNQDRDPCLDDERCPFGPNLMGFFCWHFSDFSCCQCSGWFKFPAVPFNLFLTASGEIILIDRTCDDLPLAIFEVVILLSCSSPCTTIYSVRFLCMIRSSVDVFTMY